MKLITELHEIDHLIAAVDQWIAKVSIIFLGFCNSVINSLQFGDAIAKLARIPLLILDDIGYVKKMGLKRACYLSWLLIATKVLS